MTCLDMMEFDGDEKVRQKVQQGQTLLNIVTQLTEQLNQMNAYIMQLTGAAPVQQTATGNSAPTGKTENKQAQKSAMKSTMTPYGEKLAKRATPDVSENRRKLG